MNKKIPEPTALKKWVGTVAPYRDLQHKQKKSANSKRMHHKHIDSV